MSQSWRNCNERESSHVAFEGTFASPSGNTPQLGSGVLGTCQNRAAVQCENGRVHNASRANQCLHKRPCRCLPDPRNEVCLRQSQQQGTIGREATSFNWTI